MNRRFFPVTISHIILLSMFLMGIISASAASPSSTINIKSPSAVPGASVDVNVMIENNPGVLGATLELSFDERLTLTNALQGEAWDCLTMTKPGRFISPCKFVWDGQELNENQIHDGVILKLTFDVAKNVPTGTEIPISINYDYGDVVDYNLDFVSLDINNGQITVASETLKDTVAETAVTDKQLIDIVNAALNDTESGSIEEIDSDTLEEVNKNLQAIVGSIAPQFSSVEELRKRYSTAQRNEYSEQVQINLDPSVISNTLTEVLDRRNVSSFSELSKSEKGDAVAEAYQRISKADDTLPEISGYLTVDESAEMFDELISDTSTEGKEKESEKETTKTKVFPVYIIVIAAVVICGVLVFFICKKKNTNILNKSESKENE